VSRLLAIAATLKAIVVAASFGLAATSDRRTSSGHSSTLAVMTCEHLWSAQ
jgi:hypothetical protein